MNDFAYQALPPALVRLVDTARFKDGGPLGFQDDWLGGRCGAIEGCRQLLADGRDEQLRTLMAELENVDPHEWRERAECAAGWLSFEHSDNLGSDATELAEAGEVDQLWDMMRGAAAAMLAAGGQLQWEASGATQDLKAFARHAETAIRCLSRATPMRTGAPCVDTSSAIHQLPRSLRALVEAARIGSFDVATLPSDGWLAVEWLLGYMSGVAPRVEFRHQVHLLLYASLGHPPGHALPLEVATVPASHSGVFIDPAVSGALLVHESMAESLRLAYEWARNSLLGDPRRSSASSEPLAIRIRPHFDRPVARLSGGSAGVLLACAMRGVLERRPLNRHATATACLAASSRSTSGVAADNVAEESILAKLRATRDTHPRLTHVVMEQAQADIFGKHSDVIPIGLTEIYPVQTVQQAYEYLTRDAALDDILRRHCRAVTGRWEKLQRVGRRQAVDDLLRLDRYVWPRYGLLPEGRDPSPDTSADNRAHELLQSDEGDGGKLTGGYQEIEGEAQQRLLNLLLAHRWLCVTEDAGCGKTVLTLRAASLAASPKSQDAMFEGPPLVVRLESRWPVDKHSRPLSLAAMLRRELRASLRSNPPGQDEIREAVRHALRQGRVLLILDAWDQFSPKQREFIRTRIMQRSGPAARCRVLVTSREFAVHRYCA